MAIIKQGRKFIFYGALNFLITNLVLQLLLLLNNVWLATFLSQITNFLIGFKLYGKYVFKVKKLKGHIFRKYLLFAFFAFILNSKLIIYISTSYSISKNLASAIILPFLTLLSFLTQKFLIFKE